MKKWMKQLGAAVLCGVLFCSFWGQDTDVAAKEDMRAVWISTVYSADYPSVKNDVQAQKAEFITKLDQAKALGINTAVVQIRPKADAFYPSELNPWSEILTGTQGKYPGYDPMAFMIEETHKRGMEFHAWMNPYRITTSGVDLSVLSANHMARKHPDWVMTSGGAMYFNPAKEEVKQYICDSVAEILENYDVDAIHFDDYFYPANYPLPEGEDRDGQVAQERRNHVNDLIRRVYQTIKTQKPSVEFGVSPVGIWKNSTSDPLGSATKGNEGYYSVFGDAKAWIDNGWLDYIVPQIYWERGFAAADYETLVKWWSNAVKGSGVKLYIGQGIYKDTVAKEITEELKINEKYGVEGSFYFSLRDLLNNRQGCADALRNYYGGNAQQPPKTDQTPTVQKKTAYAARAKVRVDGVSVDFQVYTIDDYTYFKLRDIADAISGTTKQFDTHWNQSTAAIDLIRGVPYSATGNRTTGNYSDTTAVTSTAKLFCDGEAKSVSAYTINDYTYYKLRDIGKLLDMGITWNEKTATIDIVTAQPYQ
ncbi:MAG: family 10 glycosylhydrolase [Anaerotignum sp.]|nr:family 10 glycosylhydrolase [Anaerotignum sp.]